MIPLRVVDPSRICIIIQACVVLHNIATLRRDYIPNMPIINMEEEPATSESESESDTDPVDQDEVYQQRRRRRVGNRFRDAFARKHFS